MRLIHLNQREAGMLRDNLVNNQQGWDYVNLLRLDRLAKALTELQGDYALRLADLVREEKQVRRRHVREEISEAEANRALLRIQYEAEDLHEAAQQVEVDFAVEDSDYRLILDKINSVEHWTGSDAFREIVIGMVEAVKSAQADGVAEDVPKQIRRR